jgi:rare lipoprotein A
MRLNMSKALKMFLFALLLVLTGFSVENPKTKTDESSLSKKPVKPVEIVRKYSSILEFSSSRKARVTWYGPGFHGRKTASGAIFDQEQFTTAHRSLPFGTMLRVTNLANGKSVIVTVNDRGPGSGYLELDLSKGAARSIDMINSGVASVTIETVTVNGFNTPVLSAY